MKCVNVVNSLPFWFSERMGHCFHVLGVGKGGYLEKKNWHQECIYRGVKCLKEQSDS